MRAKVQGGVGFSTRHTLPAKPTFRGPASGSARGLIPCGRKEGRKRELHVELLVGR